MEDGLGNILKVGDIVIYDPSGTPQSYGVVQGFTPAMVKCHTGHNKPVNYAPHLLLRTDLSHLQNIGEYRLELLKKAIECVAQQGEVVTAKTAKPSDIKI